MNILRAGYRDFDSDIARWVWLEARPGAASSESEESGNEQVDEALRSPLRFGVRQMKLLEQHADDLTSAQKAKFRDLAAYYLAQAGSAGLGQIPPRVLTRLENSSLKSLLSQRMREQLTRILDERVQQLEQLVAKSADQWNPHQAATACSLYRRLRKFAVGENGVKSLVFESARKNLITYAIRMLRRGSVSGQVQEAIENVSERNARSKPLDSKDKLFVAGVFQMFPEGSDWVDHCDSEQARQFTKEAVSDLKKNPQNPNFLTGWELLEDLSQDETEVAAEIEKEIGMDELQKLLGRSRATQFLKWASTKRGYLASHLRVLRELQEGLSLPANFSLSDWKETLPESGEIVELETKKRKTKEEYDEKKNAELKRFRSTHPDNDHVRKLLETRGKRNETYDEFWATQVGKMDELIEQWDNIRAFSVKSAETRAKTLAGQLSLENEKDTALKRKYEKEQEEYVAQYVQRLEGALEKFKEAKTKAEAITPPADGADEGAVETYRREQRNFVEDFESLIAKHLPFREEVETEVPFLKNLRESTTEFFAAGKKFEDDEKATIDVMPFSEEFKGQQTELEKQITELKASQDELLKTQQLQDEWGKVFADPRGSAEEAEKNFWNDIKNRIENHQLHAADFEILWNDEFSDLVQQHIGEIPEWEKIAEFREKFSAIVPGIFDGITLSDDALETARQADERLSFSNIQVRLEEQGVNLREMFSSPQKVDELIAGAVHGARDQIFDELERVAGNRADATWLGMDRSHGRLDTTVPDPTEVHTEHVRHESMEQETGAKLQQAKEINEAYIDKLQRRADSETNPEKRAMFLEEIEKLQELFATQSGWYRSGGKMQITMPDGSRKDFWAPGKTLLNNLDLQGRGVTQEVAHISGKLRDDLNGVKEGFQNLKELQPAERDIRVSGVLEKLSGTIESWPAERGKLAQRIEDMRVVMGTALPDSPESREFIEDSLGTAVEWLEAVDKKFSALAAEISRNGKNFTGNENIWSTLPQMLQKFEGTLDFRDGVMAEDSVAVDAYLEKDGKTLEFLDTNGFWEDGDEDRPKFRARFNEIAADYRTKFSEYKKTVSKVKSRLQGDIDNLSEDAFIEKYNLDAEHMQGLIDAHAAQELEFETLSGPFLDPDFFSEWMDQYNESPEQRLQAIAEMSKFQDLRETTEEAAGYTENMLKWVTEWDDNSRKTSVRKYTKFSLHSIYSMIKQTVDVVHRRWERKNERSVANMGMQFYGQNTAWGKDFKQKAEATEEARVKEFEEQYGEQPGWDIQKALYRAKDQDEVKACIRLLLDKGFMKWDDPGLWRTLMRLSNNAVVFRIPDDMHLSPMEIFDKVRNVCEFIWSKETFRQWDTSFDGKLKSAREGYDREFGSYENDPNARTRTLSNMLQRWKRGDSTNVDPAKFEHFISASFRDGKMNGVPDQRWYFLIMGATIINPNTGSAILSRDAFMRMNGDYLARFPHVEFFTDKDSWKLNGEIVPEGTPGAEKRQWLFKDYVAWGQFLGEGDGAFDPRGETSAAKNTERFFYKYIHGCPYARDRVQRMERMAAKEGDHDDAKSFFAEWTSNQVVSHLTNASDGAVKHSGDFWRTYLAGFDPYMKNMYAIIQEGDAKWGAAPYWQKDKEEKLREVGDRLRVALITTQTLQGNMHLTSQQSPVTFDREEWSKETGYSFSALKQRDMVNDMTRKMFASAGGDVQKYEANLDYMSALKYGNDWTTRKAAGDMPQRKKDMEELMSEKGVTQYFANTDAIEKALRDYCGGGRVMNVDFGADDSVAA